MMELEKSCEDGPEPVEDSGLDLEIPTEDPCKDPKSFSDLVSFEESMRSFGPLSCSLEFDQGDLSFKRDKAYEGGPGVNSDEPQSSGPRKAARGLGNTISCGFKRPFHLFRGRKHPFSGSDCSSRIPSGDRGRSSILSTILKGFHGNRLFDKYTRKVGKHVSLVASIYPRSLLIIGNVLGLIFGLAVALGIMKLYPFHLEVNGSPDLFLLTKSIHNTRKAELRSLFGKETNSLPILYSNKGPPGSSLLDYSTLKEIWRNEISIQSIKVVDKKGVEWGWEDICHHQPTGAILTGSPCVVLSIFGLFMINEANGIFTEKDFDEAFSGECCSGISIAKFAAGNLIKQSYFPYQYKFDENLPEWPFELQNTQEMLSIYRLNTTVPNEVRIAWENKVTNYIKSVQRRTQLVSMINTEEKQYFAETQSIRGKRLSQVPITEKMAKSRTRSTLQNEVPRDSNGNQRNWGIAHYSLEYVSAETTELANKETPLLLATFALMILFMAICISGKFPKKSRVLLSSTVVLITVYATVGSFATGMLFGVPISPLTPLFIHMLLGVVVSYMIISVRTYMKTRIYLRVSYRYLPYLNPKYVRISGNEVFIEVTQYIYNPWKGFVYQEEGDGQMSHGNNGFSFGSTGVGLYDQGHSSNELSSVNSSNFFSELPSCERDSPEHSKCSIPTETGAPGSEKGEASLSRNGFQELGDAGEIPVIIQSDDRNSCRELSEKSMWDNDTLLRIRLSVSGSVIFSSISLTCLTTCAALFLGTVVDFPIVRYYCIHAGFGIFYLFLFHWLIFLPSFALDEKRIFRRKCDLFPILRFKHSNKKSNYLFMQHDPGSKLCKRDSPSELLEIPSSMNPYSVTASPSNVSLSASNDSTKGAVLSIFTRNVYRVRREVVRNYQRYKTWWSDKSLISKSEENQNCRNSNIELNEIDSVVFNKASYYSLNKSENSHSESFSFGGKFSVQKAIKDIDINDIWIGRLMVESSKADVVMRLMCNFTFRLFACLFFILLVILGIIYCGRVNTEFSAVRYLPPTSPLHHFEETLAKSWGSEPRQMYVVFPGSDKVSWNDESIRKEFINLVDNILLNDPAVMKPLLSWVHDFETYHFGPGTPEDPDHIPPFVRECSPELDIPQPPPRGAPKEIFYKFLDEWRSRKIVKGDETQDDTICVVSALSSKLTAQTIGEYTPFIRNVIPEMHDETMLVFNDGDPSKGIKSFRIMTMIKHDPLNSQSNYETMIRLTKLIETIFEKDFPGTYIYSDWFVDAERDFNILSIVWKLLFYITLGVSIILCIIQNPLTGVFIGLVVGGINIIVILIMYITGQIFDIVAFMVLATAVSFSIEYIVHITHLFLQTRRDFGVERVRDSLLDMGPNVIYAVISTFLGVILLAFSTSESFKVFLWITTIVLCVSATVGIMIAPALLSIAYDFGNFVRDYYNNRREQEFEDSVVEIKTNNLL
ncbi:Patched family protein [Cryptosporidium felis]|nr:Patched family protein [Cryptosporidium felis]